MAENQDDSVELQRALALIAEQEAAEKAAATNNNFESPPNTNKFQTTTNALQSQNPANIDQSPSLEGLVNFDEHNDIYPHVDGVGGRINNNYAS